MFSSPLKAVVHLLRKQFHAHRVMFKYWACVLLLAATAAPCFGQLQRKIPLTKCCPDDQFYVIGFDLCQPANEPIVWPPPVYASLTGRPLNNIDSSNFVISYNDTTCPNDTVRKSATDFKLFGDGSLALQSSGEKLKPGEFCINQISVDGPGGPVFAARFCVPDPCGETSCVRKCCPMGMALSNIDKLCHRSELPFTVSFRNESGEPVVPDPSSYIVHSAMAPKCVEGFIPLSEETEDVFYILPSGQLYSPDFPPDERATHEYCIDNFFDDEKSAVEALTCFPPQPTESPDTQLALAIFPYFLLISSVFLIATFIVYAIIPEIRNIHGVSIMCHVASLAVMYIGLATIQLASVLPNFVCKSLAVIVHFTFLSTFTWLNVMSFDIWWTFSPLNTAVKPEAVAFWMQTIVDGGRKDENNPQTFINSDDPSDDDSDDSDSGRDLRPMRNGRRGRQQLGRRFIFYSIYAWSVPFIIVTVGQILDHSKNLPDYIIKPNFGLAKCWFSDRASFLAYLYGPVAVLILSNIIFFIMTIVLLYRASMDAAFATGSHQAKQKFRVIFSLFVLMGVSWMTEIISYAVGGEAHIWFFTDILNILTGVFIFFIFVCKPNVWKLLKLKCPCFERFDRCCPAFMRTGYQNRQGTTRSTRNESTMSKSTNLQVQLHEDAKRKNSPAGPTMSTQIRDSSQIESGDELATDANSKLTG